MGNNQETIKNALLFLQKTDLKGVEVPAFVEVINYLNSLLTANTEIKDKKNDII